MVDVAGDGLTATSHVLFHRAAGGPGCAHACQPIIAGRYRNGFEKVGGQWRFSSVHIIIELMGDLDHHMLIDLAP